MSELRCPKCGNTGQEVAKHCDGKNCLWVECERCDRRTCTASGRSVKLSECPSI